MDVEDRELQMKALAELTRVVDERGIHVELVADEWCNTLDDIKYFADHKASIWCRSKLRAWAVSTTLPKQSSTARKKALALTRAVPATETDRSAQVCVNIAMAVQPDQILAKPGMGVDEGYMIVYNEMQRILAVRKALK